MPISRLNEAAAINVRPIPPRNRTQSRWRTGMIRWSGDGLGYLGWPVCSAFAVASVNAMTFPLIARHDPINDAKPAAHDPKCAAGTVASRQRGTASPASKISASPVQPMRCTSDRAVRSPRDVGAAGFLSYRCLRFCTMERCCSSVGRVDMANSRSSLSRPLLTWLLKRVMAAS